MDRELFIKSVQENQSSLSSELNNLITKNTKGHNGFIISNRHNAFTHGFSIVKWRVMNATFTYIPPLL